MTGSARAIAPTGVGPTEGYSGADSSFDELLGHAGTPEPHWQPFLNALSALDPAALSERIARLGVRVRETGMAHDLFADPARATHGWRVDLIPLILPPAIWRELERALVQRARLLEAVVADIYGPQRLLSFGLIPPQVVFSDPSFLRPCRNIRPPRGYIQFFATDLARGPDGRWRVIDSHAETPAGIGHALANRMVHTHVAGDIFTACRALRLAPFFQQLQTALAERANRADPTVALLTPGPSHNDFFSHAYLARYLDMLLVEGEDLRVAGERAYLKTLDGLKPIDLIVRCVAGSTADPLELDPQGFLGPVGLLQAVRRVPDLVTNALGSAIVENRALGACLPNLCREILNEDLVIPDAPRRWLGDPQAREHVAANLDRFVIRPAQEGTGRPGRATPGRDPARLSAAERAALLEEIALRGATMVAEEKVGFGTTPSLGPDGLAPRHYAVRLFVAATASGPVVMPGGIAMTVEQDTAVALSAPDGESRDVWVVSETLPPPFVSLWRPSIEAARVQRTPRELPSRAADNLFWLGRYTERADWTLRVLRTALSRLEEDSGPLRDLGAARKSLEILLGKDEASLPAGRVPTDPMLVTELCNILLTSTDRAYGLPRTLDHIHRVASLTRDRLSYEAWRTLNAFHAGTRWRIDGAPATTGEALDLLDSGLAILAAFNGLMHENMTRNFGWSFLDMGRRLSRAFNLSELLLAVFRRKEREDETGSLLFVLELGDSFITYRSRYRQAPMLALVLDLLMMDETNPRSIAFQLAELARHLDALPQARRGADRIGEQRIVLELRSRLQLADVRSLGESEADGARHQLADLLGANVASLPVLSDAISRRYFNLKEQEPRWMRARSEREP
jgi:uncharacterized circularly permuted ATP-grasp superfamily protein/uncharacterized alpha-E superfamily protein